VTLPSLVYNTGENSLSLRWPDWAGNWQLYFATNLMPPIAWSPVTNPISSSNGEFVTDLPYRFRAEYFRLIGQ